MENSQGKSSRLQSSRTLVWLQTEMFAQTLRCSLQYYQPTSETWHGLLGPAGLSTTAGWTFVQSRGLRRDSKPLLDLCCWDNLLIAPGIAHASNYPDESSLNCFVLTGATCGLLPLQWSHSIYQWTAVKTQRTTLLFLDGGVMETVEDFGDSQDFPPASVSLNSNYQILARWLCVWRGSRLRKMLKF